MSELKACPFCECRTIYEYSNGQCVCGRCGAARNTKKQWNHRPTEDRLQKRVGELEEENSKLTELLIEALPFIDRTQGRQKELGQYLSEKIWGRLGEEKPQCKEVPTPPAKEDGDE